MNSEKWNYHPHSQTSYSPIWVIGTLTFVLDKDTQYLDWFGQDVPQGGIFGPLLFNLYTNNIPLHDTVIKAIYADDTWVMTSDKNPLTAIKHTTRTHSQTWISVPNLEHEN